MFLCRYDIDGAMGSIEAEAGSCNVTYFTPSSNVSVTCEEDQNTMWIYQKTEYESSIVTEVSACSLIIHSLFVFE